MPWTWLALLLLMAGLCALQSQPAMAQISTSGVAPQTILVVGYGNTRIDANIAHVHLGVEAVDTSVIAANRAVRRDMQRVLAALAMQGVVDGDVTTFGYNVNIERYYPDYERDDPGTVPLFPAPNEEIRYRMVHQIQVELRDLDKLTDLLDAAAQAGGDNLYIYGTDFLYEDPTSLEPAAREKALDDAQAKAEDIARLAGVELGRLLTISELTQGTTSYWDTYVPALWPRQIQFYMQLQVSYAIGDAYTATPASASSVVTSTAMMTATSPTTMTHAITDADTGADLDTVTIYGGDEETLREFLRQYFLQSFAPEPDANTSIYVGALPPDLPFTLTLPANLEIVGSVVSAGENANSQLMFTHDGDVTDTVAALRRQLENLGYRQPAAHSGEVFQSQPSSYIPMCNPEGTLSVMVNGRNLRDGTGIVRIFTNALPVDTGACGQAQSNVQDDYQHVMPSLAAPEAIAVFSSGSSSDGDSLEASIRFTGDTTIAALAEHYNAELEAAGWQQIDASQTEDVAWSGWSKEQEGQQYAATFTIVRNGGDDGRFEATLRVEMVK